MFNENTCQSELYFIVKMLEICLLYFAKKKANGNTAIVPHSWCSSLFSVLPLPHFLSPTVFQSGRPPSGSERAMPAYVPPGWACGQELHPIQDQTSLRPLATGGRGARSAQAHLNNPKLFFTCSRFLSDNKHFNKGTPTNPDPTRNESNVARSFQSDPDCLDSSAHAVEINLS